MSSKIMEIYNSQIRDTKYMEELSREVERGINRIVKAEKEKMSIEAFETYRDKFFLAAAMGEEAGFVKGFTYAATLLAECFTKEQKPTVKP